MSNYRSSAPALAHYDDFPNRWDRDKFERERSVRRAPPGDDREYFHFEEHDRSVPGRSRRDLEIEVKRDERPAPRRPKVKERDRYFEEDHYVRRRPDFFDEPTPEQIANRALAPYRRRVDIERDIDPIPIRRPPRPQFIRRQSSLDTFDRRPLPRYGDEYRAPPDVPIPLPIRRHRSPSRTRYREREYEEVKYRDLDEGRYDQYEDIRIKRERSRSKRRRSGSRAATSTRSSSSSSASSFEKVEKASVSISLKEKRGKRGKTRMPKRLAEKKAIIDLGYPFEEEEDFIIIRRALGKEHIDEIIEVSKKIRAGGETKTIYKYEEKIEGGKAPPPLPPPPASEHDRIEEFKKTTTIVEPRPPSPMSIRGTSPARSHISHAPSHHAHHSHHTSHHPREIFAEERIEESNSIGGPLTVVLPDRRSKSDREIRREIAALENERRALRLEREAEDVRERGLLVRDRDDYEVIERIDRVDRVVERERPREVIRVEKDRKGRSRSRPPNPKLVALAMSTLT